MFMSHDTPDNEKPKIEVDLDFEDKVFPVVVYFDRTRIYLDSVQANSLAFKLNAVLQEFDRRTIEEQTK